jgi:hypothetical protein
MTKYLIINLTTNEGIFVNTLPNDLTDMRVFELNVDTNTYFEIEIINDVG